MNDFDAFRESLPRITIAGTMYAIVDYDLRLDDATLYEWWLQRHGPDTRPDTPNVERLMTKVDASGHLVRWAPGTELTWCVLWATFPNRERAETARYAVEAAIGDWEEACGITFREIEVPDTTAEREDLAHFGLRYDDEAGAIVLAFFPWDPAPARDIRISERFYEVTWAKDGIMRHELGHVLGFFHEFLPEDKAKLRLGGEDIASVMNYPDLGGTTTFELTPTDAEMAQRIYGWSLRASKLVVP